MIARRFTPRPFRKIWRTCTPTPTFCFGKGTLEGRGRSVNHWLKAGIGATLRTYNPFELTARHEWRTYLFAVYKPARVEMDFDPSNVVGRTVDCKMDTGKIMITLLTAPPHQSSMFPLVDGKEVKPLYINTHIEGLVVHRTEIRPVLRTGIPLLCRFRL